MKFATGLKNARGHIVMVAALCCAGLIILAIQRSTDEPPAGEIPLKSEVQRMIDAAPARPALRELSADEHEWAAIAWRYFENNTQEASGLVNSVDGFPSMTLWDTASYLNGLVAAERLEIIDGATFDARLSQALESLAALPLYKGALPNKSYNAGTLVMTDYTGKPSEDGLGWSAIDTARLLTTLVVIERFYPDHAAAARAVHARWRLDELVQDGLMQGVPTGMEGTFQEGRIGYEEYSAKAMLLLDLDVLRALEVEDTLRLATVEGVLVPYDGRDSERFGAHICSTSEPYMLDGLEFGMDARSSGLAWAVLRAQEERHKATGILTAVSEGHVPGAPYFVYACVFGEGEAWPVLTPRGERVDDKRFLSTKAAFAWSSLVANPYTDQLQAAVVELNDPERGWFSGRFEIDDAVNSALTANTNGIILEALHFRAFGPLLNPELDED